MVAHTSILHFGNDLVKKIHYTLPFSPPLSLYPTLPFSLYPTLPFSLYPTLPFSLPLPPLSLYPTLPFSRPLSTPSISPPESEGEEDDWTLTNFIEPADVGRPIERVQEKMERLGLLPSSTQPLSVGSDQPQGQLVPQELSVPQGQSESQDGKREDFEHTPSHTHICSHEHPLTHTLVHMLSHAHNTPSHTHICSHAVTCTHNVHVHTELNTLTHTHTHTAVVRQETALDGEVSAYPFHSFPLSLTIYTLPSCTQHCKRLLAHSTNFSVQLSFLACKLIMALGSFN